MVLPSVDFENKPNHLCLELGHLLWVCGLLPEYGFTWGHYYCKMSKTAFKIKLIFSCLSLFTDSLINNLLIGVMSWLICCLHYSYCSSECQFAVEANIKLYDASSIDYSQEYVYSYIFYLVTYMRSIGTYLSVFTFVSVLSWHCSPTSVFASLLPVLATRLFGINSFFNATCWVYTPTATCMMFEFKVDNQWAV